MKIDTLRISVLIILIPVLLSAQSTGELTVKSIMEEPSIAGERASIVGISPDGSQLLYRYTASDSAGANLWLADTRTGESRLLLSLKNDASGIIWHPSGDMFAYARSGDLYLYHVDTDSSEALTLSPANERSISWTEDGNALVYKSNGAYSILPMNGGALITVTRTPGEDENDGWAVLSPDAKRLSVVRYNSSDNWELHWADYIPKTVKPRSSKRGVGSRKIGITVTDGRGDISWLKPPWEEEFRVYGMDWSHNSGMLLVDLVTTDFHERRIYVYRVIDNEWKKVWEEKDDRWLGGPNLSAYFSPDDSSILLSSEKKGYNHLFLTRPDKKKEKRLTKGDWEVSWFRWLPDRRVIYTSNEIDAAERRLYILDPASREPAQLDTPPGSLSGFRVSRDGSAIAFEHSSLGTPPDIWTLSLRSGAEPVRMTNTVPERYRAVGWTIPDLIELESHVDKRNIRALLYKPDDFDPARKYPMIVFVHGAGYVQNVVNGWTHYYREFMFHTLLTRLGYLVMDVDYRGSAGYGRDWRTDVYMQLGGLDLDDVVSGVKWASAQGFLDEERIGIYGGSYGGFLTLMALFKYPDTFAAGAALRAVTNWENYYYSNPYYTAMRLGTPEDNSEAYEISSPIHFADSLKSPLLILHGVLDSNVQFQDAAQLVQKLIDGGKNFELMIYPKEAHTFSTGTAWTDEYTRILNFFEKNVRNKGK